MFHGIQTDKGPRFLPLFRQLLLTVLLGQKGHADGSHHSRIGGTDHLPAQVLLQRPQNGVVLESSPLNDDFIS